MSRFRAVEWIASGGLADVFEAEDTVRDQIVAIKRVRRCYRGNDRVEAHWTAEARALRRLDGTRAPRLLDEGVTRDGLPYLVLDRFLGPSFRGWLETAPSVARSLEVFAEVLDSVDAAHRVGVVHGDLKTSNTMLSADVSSIWLIDFGLAELAGDAEPDLPFRGYGTPEYVAPEVVAGGRRTVASDVYAAGVMLYELLTTKPPFTGGTPRTVLERHAAEPVLPPSMRSDLAISRQLDAVALRALAKQPEDRYPTIAAMSHALERSRPTWPDERPRRPHRSWDHLPTAPWRHARA